MCKNISSHLLVLVFSMSIVLCSNAQSLIPSDNIKYIDSIEQETKLHFCNGILTYPDAYKKKGLKADRMIVCFLDKMFQEDFTEIILDSELKKIKNIRSNKEQKVNGLIKEVSLILNGNYLRVEAKLEFIDSNIFRKSCVLTTSTGGRCGMSKFRIFDFKLLREHFIQDMNFKISFRYNFIESNRFIPDKLILSSRNYPGYKFNIPAGGTDWTDRVFLNQYNSDSSCCYSYLQAHRDFVTLIKSDKIEVVKSLLYSPNYFYSIHAMEAILYLNSMNKIIIDDGMKERIRLIKESNSPLTIQKTSDLFMTVNGYKEIKTTDEAVIKKYQSSLSLIKQ